MLQEMYYKGTLDRNDLETRTSEAKWLAVMLFAQHAVHLPNTSEFRCNWVLGSLSDWVLAEVFVGSTRLVRRNLDSNSF